MADDRWQRVADLYQSAQDREPDERVAFVREASGADSGLRREVESLLAQDENVVAIDQPIDEAARSLLANNATVQPGSFIGPYRVDSLLGAGGMGEVYRARDLKLNRDVAIKILPQLFANDPDRLARFKREAQVLASLNHPNIATIHGFEDGNGLHALVLELVEGPTLADQLENGRLEIDEAIAVAKQIADALEAAHEQGIVHRDLKPANIKVREDGTVKVLDFGLAKIAEADEAGGAGRPGTAGLSTQSPTITTPAMTAVGVILGTAAYMSPEQAKGKPADKRSDIWAFGCVLYEMLTGKRAFGGEDVSDTLANVLKSDPDWVALPTRTPSPITQLLKTCLEKNRVARVADASTLRYVFGQPAIDGQASRGYSRRPVAVLAAVTLIVGVVIGALAIGLRTGATPALPGKVTRLIVPLERETAFTSIGRHLLALSPDGSRLVYVANNQLYLRRLDSLDAVSVRGTADSGVPNANQSARSPFFSPDGKWVGFWQNGKLKKVLVAGGTPVDICDAPIPWGENWAADNTIFFGGGRDGIYRIAADGGQPTLALKNSEGSVDEPQLLPDGRTMLFTLRGDNESWDQATILVQSLDTGQRKILIRGGTDARYLDTGHLVYVANGTLFAVPFDLASQKVAGGPVALVDRIAQAPFQSGAAHYAISSSGTLAYVTGTLGQAARTQALYWLDRRGRETKINAPPASYVYPRLSPDDSRIAVSTLSDYQKIWIWDVAEERLEPLTSDQRRETYPTWTRDGKHIFFAAGQSGIWSQALDSGAPPTHVLDATGFAQLPTSLALDERLVFSGGEGDRIDLLTRSPQVKVDPLVGRRGIGARNGELSPDETMLAYETNESGEWQIWVRSFPNVDGWRRQISTGGGSSPAWSKDGSELFYVGGGRLLAVAVKRESPASFGPPSKVTDNPYSWTVPGVLGRLYDVSRKSDRFLVMKQEARQQSEPAPTTIVIVQNWLDELKQKVPVR